MSRELTELWKQRKLKTNWYYCKNKAGRTVIYHIFKSVERIYHDGYGEITEVLDEVPNYYQYQNICNSLSEEHRCNYNLIK